MHVAVVVRGGNILAWATNGQNVHEHAEIRALRQTTKTKGATIYVIRVSKDGNSFMMSKPCILCRREMEMRGIKTVVYSNWDGSLITERLTTINHPPIRGEFEYISYRAILAEGIHAV